MNTIRTISAVLFALFVGTLLIAGCGAQKKGDAQGVGMAQGKSPEEMKQFVQGGGTGPTSAKKSGE